MTTDRFAAERTQGLAELFGQADRCKALFQADCLLNWADTGNDEQQAKPTTD